MVIFVVCGRIILGEVRIQLKDTAPAHLLVELRLIVGIGERLVGLIFAIFRIISCLAVPIEKLVRVFDIIQIVEFIIVFVVAALSK